MKFAEERVLLTAEAPRTPKKGATALSFRTVFPT
jgi:hypothetical protein